MSFKRVEFPPLGKTPQPHRAIGATACQETAVVTKRQAKDGLAVTFEFFQRSSTGQSPQADVAISPRARQEVAAGADGKAIDPACMPLQRFQRPGVGEAPQAYA